MLSINHLVQLPLQLLPIAVFLLLQLLLLIVVVRVDITGVDLVGVGVRFDGARLLGLGLGSRALLAGYVDVFVLVAGFGGVDDPALFFDVEDVEGAAAWVHN